MNYKYIIPGNPITKKNSQQILRAGKGGRPFIAPSAKYKQFEKAAEPYLTPKPYKPIDYPVTVRCLYYCEDVRKRDLTNLMEATHDVLTHCGILQDDNSTIIMSVDGSRVMPKDKDNPRTEIYIEEIDNVL